MLTTNFEHATLQRSGHSPNTSPRRSRVGVTNSRSNYDLAAEVARTEAFVSARFNHLEIATQTHQVEEAIRIAMLEHLKGQHIELSEVAIQHFDLPQEVEVAANRKVGLTQVADRNLTPDAGG